jgi:hypothetical protein
MRTNWLLLLSNTPYKILIYSLRTEQGIRIINLFRRGNP